MLGYRALFNLPPKTDVVDTARAQMHAWMRHKRYDADRLEEGHEVQIGRGVTALAVARQERDSSVAWRCRVTEAATTGAWTTTLTAYETSGDSPDWLLLELTPPDGWTEWIGSHRIAKYLVEATDVRDGSGRLMPAPDRVTAGGIDDLIATLEDPARRGLVYVAGTDSSLPTNEWFGYARDLLRDTVGVAASYFLDADATDAFNAAVGTTHNVAGGTIRTFFPQPDFADPSDARRHLILSTRTIIGRNKVRLSRNLGWRSRNLILAHPLPAALRRMTERLVADEDEVALRMAAPASLATLGIPVEDDSATAHDASVALIDTPPATEPPTELATAVVHWETAGSSLVRAVLGITTPSPDHLRDVELLAITSREHEARHADVVNRLRESRADLGRLTDELAEFRDRLDGEQLDHQNDADELRRLQHRNRHLETLLLQTGAASQVYSDPAAGDTPGSFEDLCILLDDLPGVVFTGDEAKAAALDTYNPLGGWAAKTWDFLLELRDYSRAKQTRSVDVDVHHYLINHGAGRASARQHARTESETVQNNPKWRMARVFPVPPSIDSRGCTEMLAHYKIAKFGTVTPRLHYFDATGLDGMVYVGYIGPHLPTKQTN